MNMKENTGNDLIQRLHVNVSRNYNYLHVLVAKNTIKEGEKIVTEIVINKK